MEFSKGLDVGNDIDLPDKEVVEDIPETQVELFNVFLVVFLEPVEHLFIDGLFAGSGVEGHNVPVGGFIEHSVVTGFHHNGQQVLVEFQVEQLHFLVHNSVLVLDLLGHEVDDFNVLDFVSHFIRQLVLDHLHLVGHLDVVVITLFEGDEGIHGGVEDLFTYDAGVEVNQFLYLIGEHFLLEHVLQHIIGSVESHLHCVYFFVVHTNDSSDELVLSILFAETGSGIMFEVVFSHFVADTGSIVEVT